MQVKHRDSFTLLVLQPWRHVEVWRYNPNILDLGSRWKCVVRFMPWPLAFNERDPLSYPLYRRVDVPKTLSGRCGKMKNILPLPEIRTRPEGP
jgi:hypothetical protein